MDGELSAEVEARFRSALDGRIPIENMMALPDRQMPHPLIDVKDDNAQNSFHLVRSAEAAALVHLYRPDFIDQRSATNDLPIHTAVRRRDLEVVKFILSRRKAHIHDVGGSKVSLLHMACEQGDRCMIEFLVSEDEQTLLAQDYFGDTPLHSLVRSRFATNDEKIAVAEFFLKKQKLLLSMTNIKEEEALHCWCRTGNLQLVRFLYKKHPSAIDSVNYMGGNILHSCVRGAHTIDPSTVRPDDSMKVIKWIVRRRPEFVHAQDDYGSTPLHEACDFHLPVLIKFFVRRYPQTLSAQDDKGRTVLHRLFYGRAEHDTNFDLHQFSRTVSFLAKLCPELTNMTDNQDRRFYSSSSLTLVYDILRSDPVFWMEHFQT